MSGDPFDIRQEQAELARSFNDMYTLYLADALPEQPEAVTTARKALAALVERCGGWDGMKRDDRRLADRYCKTIRENEIDPIEHGRKLGLLPHNDERSKK